MKALTLWQPWATLVAVGLKPYEFRRWRAPATVIGERIVIHAAKRPVDADEVRALLDDDDRLRGSLGFTDPADFAVARRFLEGELRDGGLVSFPLAAGLAEATLGTPMRAIDLFASHMDPADINPDMWAWPMEDVREFPRPVPRRGKQGFWDWDAGDPPPRQGGLF